MALTPHILSFRQLISASGLITCLFFLTYCEGESGWRIQDEKESIHIHTDYYQLEIEKVGFRFQFSQIDGQLIAPFHASSGLLVGQEGRTPEEISTTRLVKEEAEQLTLAVETSSGLKGTILLSLAVHSVKLSILPEREGKYTLIARTGALGPAYGMADHAAVGEGGLDLLLEAFVRDTLGGDNGRQRMISNFVIFPKQGFATVNMEMSSQKLVRITKEEQAQGAHGVRELAALYYFIGSPKEIYASYLAARNREGHPVYKPKSEWFGVGWEAFGALAWKTNHTSVTENIDQYLDYGYPLTWMVVGSGFWPRGVGEFDAHGTPYTSETKSEAAKKLQATTSFGMWDKDLYPNPKDFIDYFHRRGLIFTIGLRIGFIPGGPFTPVGVEKGYFLKNEKGVAELQKVGFPRVPVYLLDSNNPEAVKWYVALCQKWRDFGVDGFKEDLFHWPEQLQDDLIDPINRALMEDGVYIMGRNNYLGSPADIHRFDDFNYNQSQDRGPINGLAYAFSGFPYVYPDIIGGTGLATGRFGEASKEKLRVYLVRYAQYASLNPAMAFGFGPWNFDEETNQLCLAAAQRHHRLQPHIYSNAIKAYHTGFPYPMTPLPLAFPDDDHVYGLADTIRRGYQWMIGESLLAAPLYGDDYDRATTRDIYLPKGKWMDYDSGQLYEGPQTLKDFEIPIDKAPLFVGGTGFVLEQEADQLFGRIYPIDQQANIDCWHMDGETKSTLHIEVKDWAAVKIMDETTGEEVPYKLIRHAYQFEFIAGHTYTIQ